MLPCSTESDLVEEVRVIVGPSAAETSRGAGAVQMADAIRNEYLSRQAPTGPTAIQAMQANQWFNNFNRVGQELQQPERVRAHGLGGPIVKNQDVFLRILQTANGMLTRIRWSALYLTQQARQGTLPILPASITETAHSNNPTGRPRRPIPCLNGVARNAAIVQRIHARHRRVRPRRQRVRPRTTGAHALCRMISALVMA
jgi:hypothetical protein